MAINSIKHKGLKLLFIKGDESKVQQQLLSKIRRLLVVIDTLEKVPEDLEDLPGLKPHKLKGDLSNYWAISVSGNYRIIFTFDSENKNANDLDLVDYH